MLSTGSGGHVLGRTVGSVELTWHFGSTQNVLSSSMIQRKSSTGRPVLASLTATARPVAVGKSIVTVATALALFCEFTARYVKLHDAPAVPLALNEPSRLSCTLAQVPAASRAAVSG